MPWSNSIIRQAARWYEDCAFSEGVIRVREDLAIEIKRDRLLIQPSYTCLLGRYWMASARPVLSEAEGCAASTPSLPTRSKPGFSGHRPRQLEDAANSNRVRRRPGRSCGCPLGAAASPPAAGSCPPVPEPGTGVVDMAELPHLGRANPCTRRCVGIEHQPRSLKSPPLALTRRLLPCPNGH